MPPWDAGSLEQFTGEIAGGNLDAGEFLTDMRSDGNLNLDSLDMQTLCGDLQNSSDLGDASTDTTFICSGDFVGTDPGFDAEVGGHAFSELGLSGDLGGDVHSAGIDEGSTST